MVAGNAHGNRPIVVQNRAALRGRWLTERGESAFFSLLIHTLAWQMRSRDIMAWILLPDVWFLFRC